MFVIHGKILFNIIKNVLKVAINLFNSFNINTEDSWYLSSGLQMEKQDNKNPIDDATYAQISSMFQRPSQLEKIDELLKKSERKKVLDFRIHPYPYNRKKKF